MTRLPLELVRARESFDRMTRDSRQTYIAGVAYPATKLEVIAAAEANGAPQELIEDLQAVGTEQFRTAEEVRAALPSDRG